MVMQISLMLGIPLVLIWTDMETFFPRSKHAVLDIPALFAGLPSGVRQLAMTLYEDALAQYDTAHGLWL